MTRMVKKSFDAPDEIRSFDKSKIEVVDLGDVEVIRVTNQPGCAGRSVSNRLLEPIVAKLGTSSMSSTGG
jgi:hypothetical protein